MSWLLWSSFLGLGLSGVAGVLNFLARRDLDVEVWLPAEAAKPVPITPYLVNFDLVHGDGYAIEVETTDYTESDEGGRLFETRVIGTLGPWVWRSEDLDEALWVHKLAVGLLPNEERLMLALGDPTRGVQAAPIRRGLVPGDYQGEENPSQPSRYLADARYQANARARAEQSRASLIALHGALTQQYQARLARAPHRDPGLARQLTEVEAKLDALDDAIREAEASGVDYVGDHGEFPSIRNVKRSS